MDNIILDIYRCNFSALENIHAVGPQHAKAMRKNIDIQKRFESCLSPEQQKEFENYKQAAEDIQSLDGEHDFLAGYRLGVRMAFAALQEPI